MPNHKPDYILKFWAWVYRLTGYMSKYAKVKEYEFIKAIIFNNKIDKVYDDPNNDLDYGDLVGIEIGMWEYTHGFYRESWKSKVRRWKRNRVSWF